MCLVGFLLLTAFQSGNAGAGMGDLLLADESVVVNGEPSSACRVGMRVYESERGRQLLGEIIPADLHDLLPGWDKEMALYTPDPTDIVMLAEISQQVEIICVLGTWCSDSQREVPRFWKVLNEADNPNLEFTMFAVGRSSDSEARHLMESIGFDESLRLLYGVELVPTFIFSIAGREIGRIIETPTGTLEGDMTGILSKNTEGGGASAWH